MTAPSTWSSPASQGSASATQVAHVSYLDGRWIAITQPNSGSSPVVRYATDPTGTWTNGSAITNPSGTNSAILSPPFFDGTYYGFYLGAIQTSPDRYSIYSVYTTDPTGTWTVGTVSTPDRLMQYGGYLNGQWVVAGYDVTGNVGFVGTSSSINGTYSFDTSSHGLPAGERVLTLDHDGTNYMMGAGLSSSSYFWRYSTSITGSWTAVSALNALGNFTLNGMARIWHPTQGYWMPIIYSPGYTVEAYAASASSSTWGTASGYLDSSTIQIDSVYSVAANGDYWVAVGQDGASAKLSYIQSAASPSGTWTAVTGGFSGGIILAVGWGNDYFVGMDANGNIRYSYSPAPPPVATTTRYLRQRQSPVRTPSRVRSPQLRQRQRPETT